MSELVTAQPLHRESIEVLNMVKSMNIKPLYEMESVEVARASVSAELGGRVEYDGTRTEVDVPLPDVPDGIPVWIYKPNNVVADPPILVYLHGGGNVIGNREGVDSTCKILSSGSGCLVVNVEYRLGPEHKLPAGLDDACGVTKWVLDNRTKIGGSASSKVGVSGVSGGGAHAASVAQDVPGVGFQILIYAQLSARGDRHLKSYEEYKDGPILDAKLLDWFERYACDEKDWKNPRYANLRRDKFDHLPPTLFIVSQCDPLRDDSYEYQKKLEAAGVHCEFHLVKGALHGFFTLPGIFKQLTSEAYTAAIDFIKRYGTTTKKPTRFCEIV